MREISIPPVATVNDTATLTDVVWDKIRLRVHPLIGQGIVIGDQKPFVAALVTIDEEA